jgi:hypothetical protein
MRTSTSARYLALLVVCFACEPQPRRVETGATEARSGTPEGVPNGRLLLRDFAARQLGLRTLEMREVDSLRVPLAVRSQANSLRDSAGGDSASVVRYYAGAGEQLAEIAALVPSRSFEGEDPHIVAGFRPDGSPLSTTAHHTFVAVEVYCPVSSRAPPGGSARDSTDGCRYFHDARKQ